MDLSVRSDNFKADYKYLTKNVVCIRRLLELDDEKKVIDVFPNCWVLGVGEAQTNVSLRFEGQESVIMGKGLIFIPIRSLLEWNLSGPKISFQAFLCQLPASKSWPLSPRYEDFKNIDSKITEKIVGVLEGDCKVSSGFQWELWIQIIVNEVFGQRDPVVQVETTLAKRLKDLLDDNFTEELSLDKISQKMGVSKSYLIRAFRKHYHLTPGEYRKRCRIYYSMYKLLFEQVSATEAGFESGYNNLGHFYEYFKDTLGVSPGAFKL